MNSEIVAVTVYPHSARVTRRGRTRLEAGPQRLVVGGLPQELTAESVRVAARGAATVHGVDVVPEHHPRSPDPGVEELRQRLDALRLRLDELTDTDAVEQGRVELLGSVARQSGKAFAKALATAATDATSVATVNDALAAQLAEVLTRRREQHAERQRMREELEQAERELDARMAQHRPDRLGVAVALEVAEADAEIELEVSYVVDHAHWSSHYDLRLTGERLTVTWYGMVSQFSGEDWPGCELSLSTARPAHAVRIPELRPWFLDRVRPAPPAPPPAPAMAGAMAYGGEESLAVDTVLRQTARAAVAATAQVDHGVAAATYTPTRPVAVPSDGSEHRTTLLVEEFEARLDHVTAPVLAQEAYLRATAVNGSEHTLLPGQASVFHEAEFVGSTRLEPWAPSEEIELALGVDDRVRVERELIRRGAGKVLVGRTRHRDAGYKITVGNYGPRAANVTVLDHVPVSRDEGIVVRDVNASPKPAEQSDLGELTWKLSVEPGATAEIKFGFRVELGKDVEVAGWPS